MSYEIHTYPTGKMAVVENVSGDNITRQIKKMAVIAEDELGDKYQRLLHRWWVNDEVKGWKSASYRLPRVVIYVSDDEQNFNVYAALSANALVDVSAPMDLYIIITDGVVVGSTIYKQGAMYSSSTLAAGSSIHLENRGIISGWGGYGIGAEVDNPHIDGCVALELFGDVQINNGDGYIFGGGGGASGFYGFVGLYYLSLLGGSGQGSGPNKVGPNSKNGPTVIYTQPTRGDTHNPGLGGTGAWWDGTPFRGGNGGAAGEPGNYSPDGMWGGTPGEAGDAIHSHSHTIVWESGNTSSRVKGAIIS